MRSIALTISAVLTLSACSAMKDKQAAEAEVVLFHNLYDAGQGTKIYDEAGHELKTAVSKDAFDAMLDTVHHRLGNVRKTGQKGWAVNYGTGGNIVTLTYTTDFALAEGEEAFVYRMAAGKPVLAGYHITSKALPAK